MSSTSSVFHDLLEALEEHPEWRAELRRLLLPEELLNLPDLLARMARAVAELAEAQRRTDQRMEELAATVQGLAEAQRRTEQRVEELAEAQRRTEKTVEELAESVRQLAEAQRDMGRSLAELADWRRGEAGRREGEAYERSVARRAPSIFGGGEGGPPGTWEVQQRLTRWLAPLFAEGQTLKPQEDPYLADLVWWKGDRVLVVEVSVQVDEEDVRRAHARAALLRKWGGEAVGVVVGERWSQPQVGAEAEQLGIEWFVADTMSPGLIAFRKLPVT